MPVMSAPQGFLSPEALARNQQAQASEITPDAAALNTQLKTLPAYQQYVQAFQQGGTVQQRQQATQSLRDAAGALPIPKTVIFDPSTGQFRQKNWNERNSNWSALMYTGAAIGAGLTAGAAVGALGAAGGGATIAGTNTVGPLAGGLAGATTEAAVPAALAATEGGALAAGGTAAAGGVIAGTNTVGPLAGGLTGATTTAEVPAALAANTATVGGGGSVLSKTLAGLTSSGVLSTIAQGAFGLYAASQAAGASVDAAKIIADANTAAAKLATDAQIESAKIQANSTADALDFTKAAYGSEVDRYNANQAQLAPYTGAGDAAVTKLSQLMGLGTPPAYVAPPPLVLPPTTRPAATAATATPSTPAPVNAVNSAQQPPANSGPAPGTIASVASPPPAQSPQTMPLAPQTPSQPMVTLQAPTGEVAQKPASELQHWLSLGAQQVPGTQLTAGAP